MTVSGRELISLLLDTLEEEELKRHNEKILATVFCLVASFNVMSDLANAKEKPVTYKKGSCAARLFQVKKSPGHWYAYAQSAADAKRNFSCASSDPQSRKTKAINVAVRDCNHQVAIPPTWGKIGSCRVRLVK